MKREDLKKIFENVDESKKQIIETMFDDFIFEVNKLEEIKPKLSKLPNNPREAERFKFYEKEYSNISQRHDSKIKIFLSVLGKYETETEDEYVQWINNNQ